MAPALILRGRSSKVALHFMSDKELSRVEVLREVHGITVGRETLRRVNETAVLENKRLGGLLTLIRQSQQSDPPGMRTSKGPKRRDQAKHMFSAG